MAKKPAVQAVQAVPAVQATTTPAAAVQFTYTLNPTALALAAQGAAAPNTLQRSAKGQGKAWRTTGKAAPNTRAQACAVLATLATPFTFAQATGALAGLHAGGVLGSGTPNSYCKVFVQNGYFMPTK